MDRKKIAQFIYELRKDETKPRRTRIKTLYWQRSRVPCPDPAVLLQLSEFFNVSVDELLYINHTK